MLVIILKFVFKPFIINVRESVIVFKRLTKLPTGTSPFKYKIFVNPDSSSD